MNKKFSYILGSMVVIAFIFVFISIIGEGKNNPVLDFESNNKDRVLKENLTNNIDKSIRDIEDYQNKISEIRNEADNYMDNIDSLIDNYNEIGNQIDQNIAGLNDALNSIKNSNSDFEGIRQNVDNLKKEIKKIEEEKERVKEEEKKEKFDFSVIILINIVGFVILFFYFKKHNKEVYIKYIDKNKL